MLGIWVGVIDGESGLSFGGSKFCLLRTGLLFEAARMLPDLPSTRPSTSARSATVLNPKGPSARTEKGGDRFMWLQLVLSRQTRYGVPDRGRLGGRAGDRWRFRG